MAAGSRPIAYVALAAALMYAVCLAPGCGRADRSTTILVWEQMDPQEQLLFEELFSGRDNASALASASYPGEVRVARTQAEYDALWRYIAPNRRPPAQPASLDFSNQQVVAVMTPQRLQDFGGLAVHRVLADQDGALRVYADVVPYTGTTPQAGPHGPWIMVRTNKTSGSPRAEQYTLLTGTGLVQGHSTFHGPRMMSVARDDQAYRQWEAALGQTLPVVDPGGAAPRAAAIRSFRASLAERRRTLLERLGN